WDALAHADAPGLSGDEARFAVTADGRTISGDASTVEALEPLVRAIGMRLEAPFWAIAVPDEGERWEIAGTNAEVLELPDATGDEIEASRVGGETSGRVDGEEASLPPGVTALLDGQEGDTAILANRFAGPVWVAEIYPL